MKYGLKLFFCSLALAIVTSGSLLGQLPTDLSKVKSSQITDAQLTQYVQQAQVSGMTETELIQELQKRGLNEVEILNLSTRIKALMSSTSQAQSQDQSSQTLQDNKRYYKGNNSNVKPIESKSRVFGSELFSSEDPLFSPNLKIATPKNYIIGAEDELQLDIYGNNISSQKLTVSPDGFINVKYAGPVNVTGMSIEQASGIIKARLTRFYPAITSGNTKVQLTLGSIRSIQVTVVGAVKRPGTITLPSIGTLFNALYASGGPLENGSYRSIELVRNGKVVANADLYDLLLRGEQTGNVILHDNDIIRVPYVKTQISIEGGVNRAGLFEIKDSESLQKALDFAGGFKGNSFKGRIRGTRYTDFERKVIDIEKSQYSIFKLNNGDSIYVDLVVDKFENRVVITGAVYKPGMYSLESGMDLKLLIQKSQGLKDDAFLGRSNIVRTRTDLTKEYESVDLKSIMKGNEVFVLKKEDSIHISSILELKDQRTVSINGPVRNEGEYKFEDSLTLQSLILQAGGFKNIATATSIEIGRRRKNIELSQKGAITAEIIQVPMTKDLTKLGADFYLEPYDIVSIKIDPSNQQQITVKISGEVLNKGVYTLENPVERLSSVLKRAGGLLPYADINGAKLIRQKKQAEINQIKRIIASSSKSNENEIQKKDSIALSLTNDIIKQPTVVSLDLSAILNNPGGDDDLTFQQDDELIIPKMTNMVSVNGEVLNPITIQFGKNENFSSYISAAGGFTRNANKNRSFIVYSNGKSSSTRNVLGMRIYPAIRPGSEIFIPSKPSGKGFDAAKAGILISALTALSTLAVLLFK